MADETSAPGGGLLSQALRAGPKSSAKSRPSKAEVGRGSLGSARREFTFWFSSHEGEGTYTFAFGKEGLQLNPEDGQKKQLPSFVIPYRWINLVDIREFHPLGLQKFGIEFVPDGRVKEMLGKFETRQLKDATIFLEVLQEHVPREKIKKNAVPKFFYTPELMIGYSGAFRTALNIGFLAYCYIMGFGAVFFILKLGAMTPDLNLSDLWAWATYAWNLLWTNPLLGIPLACFLVIWGPAYIPMLLAYVLVRDAGEYIVGLSMLAHLKTLLRAMSDIRKILTFARTGGNAVKKVAHLDHKKQN